MLFHLFISVLLMAQSYQTQPYEVISTLDRVEIRYYPPAMKVEVESTTTNNRNFNALFKYISGNNEDREKIAMTTPVYMENKKDSQTMAFVLPAQYTDTAPEPKGNGLRVYQSKAGYFAAIRYGGYSNPKKVQLYTEQLKKILAQAEKKIIGQVLVLSYDAPYKFYNRRNEILLEIEQ
ncbi:MAG: SOUL family heme-binding protein [Flavobacteriaceae bacterium]